MSESSVANTLVVGAVCILIAVGSACSAPPPTEAEPVEAAPPAEPPPPFAVPGSAFADGRDQEAQPPLTIMQINVWNAVPRQSIACQVTHGSGLTLNESRYAPDEERYYFLVESNGCKGWLPESFMSATRQPAIGDRQ